MNSEQNRINGDLTDPAAFRTNLLEAIGEPVDRMTNAQVLVKIEAKIAEIVPEPESESESERWLKFTCASFRAEDVTAIESGQHTTHSIATVHLSLNGDHVEIRMDFLHRDDRDEAIEVIEKAAFGGGPINE